MITREAGANRLPRWRQCDGCGGSRIDRWALGKEHMAITFHAEALVEQLRWNPHGQRGCYSVRADGDFLMDLAAEEPLLTHLERAEIYDRLRKENRLRLKP